MKKFLIVIAIIAAVYLGWRYFNAPPEIRNAHPVGDTIICFGDSLTSGVGASAANDYPSLLAAKFGKPVINAGVPGDTTATALKRLEEDVLDRSPAVVFITLGGNDIRRSVPKETAFGNLRQIVTAIQEKGALVVIAGIDIPFWGKGYGQAYRELAQETGVVLIPNIFNGIIGKSEYMSDQIHPNNAGYAIFADRFYEAVKPYL